MTDTTTEGWTPWSGGKCPVARGLTVEVELRDGSKAIQVAGDWYWPHYGPTQIAGSGDIIAYRILSPAVPDPVAAAVEAWPLGTHVHIDHDGFSGRVVGHYQRDDGYQGVVLQQDGTKVVHVYGIRHCSRSQGDGV